MNILVVVLLIIIQSVSTTTDEHAGGMVHTKQTTVHDSRDYLPSMPGWPKTIGAHPNYAPVGATMADLDGDGIMEIMCGSTNGEFKVWDINGDIIFSKSGMGMIQSKPAIGDIDLDGEMEIIVTNRTNAIYIWKPDGTNHPGWPVYVSEVSGLKSPVLFDLIGDDTLEIIVGERDWPQGKINVFKHDGTLLWSDTLDYMCVATPSVGDIDNDGTYEIVAASYYSLYVWDANGNLEPNWPLTIVPNGGMSYSQPTLVDLDGDKDLEIAITYYNWDTGNDYLGIWDHDATPFAGWPQDLWGGQSYGTPMPADIDFDSIIELCDASSHYTNGPLHLYSSAGVEESGWPFYFTGYLEGTPIAFDFDNDDLSELLIANNSTPGAIYVLNYNGTQVPNAPFDVQGAFMVNGATVGDADGDGDVEICLMVTAGATGYVNLFTLESIPYKGYLAPYFSWFHDRWNTGWIHPAPPESLTLGIPVRGTVMANWIANDEPDILGYFIYRSDSSGGPYLKLNATPYPYCSFIDTTTPEDQMCYYAISAVIKAGAESYLSEEDSIYVFSAVHESKDTFSQPHILCSTLSKGQIEISFSNLNLRKYNHIELFDVAGRRIKQWIISTESGTRVLSVHPGIYFIQVQNSKITQKAIVF